MRVYPLLEMDVDITGLLIFLYFNCALAYFNKILQTGRILTTYLIFQRNAQFLSHNLDICPRVS